MDEILLFLLKKGAAERQVRLTTGEIGSATGMSQQNASRRLSGLESRGMIKRKNSTIAVTKKGTDYLRMLAQEIISALERRITITGKIVDGVGEGKYYLSLPGYKNGIRKKLGFSPFPGTLNILLNSEGKAKRNALSSKEPVTIEGFTTKTRSFGDLFAYPCRINNTEGAIVLPLRSHYGPEILEIISSHNLKQKLGKKPGDMVTVVL